MTVWEAILWFMKQPAIDLLYLVGALWLVCVGSVMLCTTYSWAGRRLDVWIDRRMSKS